MIKEGTYFFTPEAGDDRLKPGDMFTYVSAITLWSVPAIKGEVRHHSSDVIERVDPGVVCMVIACDKREYMVMPPSKKYGWVSLDRMFVQKL